jgi:hypothetical protein
MTVLISLCALAAALACAVSFYLASPNQKLRPERLSLRTAFILCGTTAVIALFLLRQVSEPAASVFILLTIIMLACVLMPIPIALLARRKANVDER